MRVPPPDRRSRMTFLSALTGSFAMSAAENPTVAMIEAAYRHHGIDARYINCEVSPTALGDAVRGARAMGWLGFNCSIPHKAPASSATPRPAGRRFSTGSACSSTRA
jgi:shikimate 5-dehydrogenase